MKNSKEECYSISKVVKIVGLPSSTIRYYEKEFPFYLNVKKSPGGHRRYTKEQVEKVLYLKKLIHEQGYSLKEVKSRVLDEEDPKRFRQEIDLLIKVTSELTNENIRIRSSLEELSKRVAALEEKISKQKGFLKRFL